jgi:hypothetical protein
MSWLRQMLDRVSSGSGAPAAVPPVIPSHAGPHCDGNLVNALKSDHRKLLEIHARIGRLLAERRYSEIPGQLVALRTRLETHALTENVRLYGFLERLFQGDPQRLAELAELRAETNTVLLAVLKFVKNHRRTTFDESRQLSFVDEHRRLGALLARHALREERDLYQLYPSL